MKLKKNNIMLQREKSQLKVKSTYVYNGCTGLKSQVYNYDAFSNKKIVKSSNYLIHNEQNKKIYLISNPKYVDFFKYFL